MDWNLTFFYVLVSMDQIEDNRGFLYVIHVKDFDWQNKANSISFCRFVARIFGSFSLQAAMNEK